LKFLPGVLCAALAAAAPTAWAQVNDAAVCPVQPRYPLPQAPEELRELAERLEPLSQQGPCLKDANFHAWRGAILMALGRTSEAVEPLERALMTDPQLHGAQMDLAQAMALQGDRASAASLLEDLRRRAQLPSGVRDQLAAEIAVLRATHLPDVMAGVPREWTSSWQVAALGGFDTNLNNAPSASEVTLTFPQGNVTLPIDPAGRPRKGGAILTSANWQGVRPLGDSVWVVQAEMRARHTGESATSYQQTDLAANWLQSPLAASQWMARIGASYFRFGGSTLLWTTRASLQFQGAGIATGMGGIAAHCRPIGGVEAERRLYPSGRSLDGYYRGATAGVLCRPASEQPLAPPVFSLNARFGEEKPFDADRPGGTYRRAEVRSQWEGRMPMYSGQYTLRWSTTWQGDSAPYSALLGNIPRRTLRHSFQAETSWPLRLGLSLVANLEGAVQRSNIEAFDSRQTGVYLGLRWDSMQ
jgi:tetratricopeptide (TPR) repeat protein